MKTIVKISILVLFFGCKSSDKKTELDFEILENNYEFNRKSMELSSITTQNSDSTKQLQSYGKKTVHDLKVAPFDSWYRVQYEEYSPDMAEVKALKKLSKDVAITIFMGTWCSDSKREVPRFYHILDLLKFDPKKVTLIFVDENKSTPENLEDGLNITNVPTFIFYRKEKEIGRIVETPVESLEKDMFKILMGLPYTHNMEE